MSVSVQEHTIHDMDLFQVQRALSGYQRRLERRRSKYYKAFAMAGAICGSIALGLLAALVMDLELLLHYFN